MLVQCCSCKADSVFKKYGAIMCAVPNHESAVIYFDVCMLLGRDHDGPSAANARRELCPIIRLQ